MTGNVPYAELDNAEPVAFVLRQLGYRFGSAWSAQAPSLALRPSCSS